MIGMIVVLWATALGVYGVWYSLAAKEFTVRHHFSGRAKYRYKPLLIVRIMVFAVSVTILIAGLAEIARLSK